MQQALRCNSPSALWTTRSPRSRQASSALSPSPRLTSNFPRTRQGWRTLCLWYPSSKTSLRRWFSLDPQWSESQQQLPLGHRLRPEVRAASVPATRSPCICAASVQLARCRAAGLRSATDTRGANSTSNNAHDARRRDVLGSEAVAWAPCACCAPELGACDQTARQVLEGPVSQLAVRAVLDFGCLQLERMEERALLRFPVAPRARRLLDLDGADGLFGQAPINQVRLLRDVHTASSHIFALLRGQNLLGAAAYRSLSWFAACAEVRPCARHGRPLHGRHARRVARRVRAQPDGGA